MLAEAPLVDGSGARWRYSGPWLPCGRVGSGVGHPRPTLTTAQAGLEDVQEEPRKFKGLAAVGQQNEQGSVGRGSVRSAALDMLPCGSGLPTGWRARGRIRAAPDQPRNGATLSRARLVTRSG